MSRVTLNLPILRQVLPPPPPGSLDDYYAFLTACAEVRPAIPHDDREPAVAIPPFRLPDGDENP
jgi:hypothetical protein